MLLYATYNVLMKAHSLLVFALLSFVASAGELSLGPFNANQLSVIRTVDTIMIFNKGSFVAAQSAFADASEVRQKYLLLKERIDKNPNSTFFINTSGNGKHIALGERRSSSGTPAETMSFEVMTQVAQSEASTYNLGYLEGFNQCLEADKKRIVGNHLFGVGVISESGEKTEDVKVDHK